ncbi:AcrR family transcriptional regulator [Pseudomonas sp. JAI115]|uniref:TetR family transcriptional regulator n=1 Tax=Pseudomonas sp. JAI115 TaxID=2723061 RepID=UPI00161EE67C|nr:TetR family transcriptional regulator [Pseudomonas sp. JAI115]MBB6157641.1 AcrR family transcriptional regulator [Pseudomonas sp. JAI115]
MTIAYKTSEVREKELRLALARIQHGRARSGETKVSIAAVAREAGVSRALIHNHYPGIAEVIREAQGHSSRVQRDVKHQKLQAERDRNRALRLEIEELREKISKLASLNEMLRVENLALKSIQ